MNKLSINVLPLVIHYYSGQEGKHELLGDYGRQSNDTQRNHVLIFEIWDMYTAKETLQYKEVKDLEMGRLSWISQQPQCNHKYPYKRKVKMPKLGYVMMGKKVREKDLEVFVVDL